MPDNIAKREERSWRRFFTEKQLQTAKNFIDKGKYSRFVCNDRYASAIIANQYNPTISDAPTRFSENWDPDRFDCTCSSSRSNKWYGSFRKPCSHEAALLLLWEQKHGKWIFTETDEEREERLLAESYERDMTLLQKQKKKEDVIPKKVSSWKFDDATIDDAVFFDVPAIVKNEDTTQYALNRAKVFVDETKFKEEPKIEYGEDGRQMLKIYTVTEDRFETAHAVMTIAQDGIKDHSCTCSGYGYGYEWKYRYGFKSPLCGHEIAALNLVWKYVNEYNPGDATDKKAEKLFSFLENNAIFEVPEEQKEKDKEKNISIIPRILISDNEMNLTFKISKNGGKGLILKNYRLFQDAMENDKEFSLGKSLKLDFSKETVTEESEKWLEYIFGRIGDADRINHKLASRGYYGYYGKGVAVESHEVLEGASLDRFYSLTEGMDVEYENKQEAKKGMLHVGEVKTKIDIYSQSMKDYSGKLIGIKIKGKMPVVLRGQSGKYIISDTKFGKIPDVEWAALQPFFGIADHIGNIDFHVGKNRLAEFYYRVVPGMIDNPYINYEDKSGNEVEAMLPPEAEFKFKLDIVDGRCSAVCEVSYDDKTYNLPEHGFSSSSDKKEYHDLKQEYRVIDCIKKYFTEWNNDAQMYFSPKGDETLFRIITDGVSELSRYGEVMGSSDFMGHSVADAPKFDFKISVESGLLDIDLLSRNISREELAKVYKSYKLKKKFYKLKDGSFLDLSDDLSFESIETMADGINMSVEELIKNNAKVPLFRALYLDKLLEKHEEIVCNRDKTYRTLVKGFKTIRDADYEIPENMQETLRQYQVYGHKWMRTVTENGFGGILADEMGLGKTLETISVMCTLKQKEDYKTSLVVCPASLVYNWEEEINRFAPELKVQPVAGTVSARKKILELVGTDDGADVYITSYDQLRADVNTYKDKHFTFMVIDEAQYIKNSKAAMTKAVKIMNADMRMALTGTPIENRLAELWSIFDYLMPGFLYDYSKFAADFESPITKNKDEKATARLKNMVGPFILRRRKEDVLKDLPPKLEEIRYAKFDKKQRELYDAQVLKMKGMLSDNKDGSEDKIKIFAELTHIRQICCDPSLMFEDYDGDSAKREACIELVKNAIGGGHRMLIFSQFTSMLELLEKDLEAEKIPYFKITGATSKEKRMKFVHDFNEGDVPVFLISLKAGGTGLNLTGADMVIHYDPWWNVAAQNQATDRAHRIGQKKAVTVYKLIAKNTIEERIIEMQEAKKDLADAILSGEQKSIMTLTNDELLELLN